MVDEMCIIIMEENNKIYQRKHKEKEEERKRKERFEKDMSAIFEKEAGEVW